MPCCHGGPLIVTTHLSNPCLTQSFRNPIRMVDLDTDRWGKQLEEILGKRDLQRPQSYVVHAWKCMKMHDVLASAGNMSMEEGLLVCRFLELVVRAGTYPDRSLAVVTTHYAQMVWL